MNRAQHQGGKARAVSLAILGAIVLYMAAVIAGLPQYGTQQIVADNAHQAGRATPEATVAPPTWMVLPFALLLIAIAVLPLMRVTEQWWESNRNRFLVAMVLATITLAYYAFLHGPRMEGHWPAHHLVEPVPGPVQLNYVVTVLENALLQEFVPFFVLLFSLFTITGGIRISGDLEARPRTNAAILATGGILASFIGTTGAAMLLIRLLLETNYERKHVVHTIMFFIFIVCNCGGCLLPIGDPPLFLGYLKGVPFLWTLELWPYWLFVNGILLALYLLLDSLWFHRREAPVDRHLDATIIRPLRVVGWQLNAPLLAGVVLAVGLLDPGKAIPGTNWHPWMYLREVVQLTLVAISLWFGSDRVRAENGFNYHAILEVAALFSGMFITMQPALQILDVHGERLGITRPWQFFWATGTLSSVLDNAPTYLVFFQTGQALSGTAASRVAGVDERILIAVSLGAVFMGAMTYIGNGPNFMVRAIASHSGVRMPSFFGYMVYSCIILLPLFALMVWQLLL